MGTDMTSNGHKACRGFRQGVALFVGVAAMLMIVSGASAQRASGPVSAGDIGGGPADVQQSAAQTSSQRSGQSKTTKGVVQIGTGLIGLIVAISVGSKLKSGGTSPKSKSNSKSTARASRNQAPSGSTRFR